MVEKIKKVAILAAKKAGADLFRRYKKFDRNTVKLKHNHEILTQADLAAEKIILKEIKKNFPDHKILSEESGHNHKKSDYIWVIDPLDGTTNFSMHNPLWNTSIGVAYKNKIILGVIFSPTVDEIYVAQKGKGATLNGKKIKVSKTTKKALHTFCHERSNKNFLRALKYYEKQKLKQIDCRQLGSAAIELGYVAAGRTESIMIPGVHPWDVAAGILIVREAGGKVTDFEGKEWELNSKDMLATNRKVHNEILKVINSK